MKYEEIINIIDTDWIEDNPYECKQLIDTLVYELECRNDVIELQREELILCKAIIESK